MRPYFLFRVGMYETRHYMCMLHWIRERLGDIGLEMIASDRERELGSTYCRKHGGISSYMGMCGENMVLLSLEAEENQEKP